ncbi:hypothetical protein JCM3775_001036 [Rhodotorula graminis]
MATSVTNQQIDDALKEAGLIGSSVIPSTFKNQIAVQATYGAFGNVQPGSTYSVADTQAEPTISFNAPPGPDSRFTVVVADPDAPSRDDQKWSPFLHFVLADVVPGKEAGQSVVTYMGPAPPQGTGPHRYAILVYAQAVDHTPELPGQPDDRQSFPLGQFVKDNQLDLVGATFFYAENK